MFHLHNKKKYKRLFITKTLLSLVAVFLVFVGVGFFHMGQLIVEPVTDFGEKILPFSFENLASAKGGDLSFEPPVIVPPPTPEFVGEELDMSSFTANGIIVKDAKTGAILLSQNEYGVQPIASITKLMSALLLLEEQPDWTTSTQVVLEDLVDTHMYEGDTYTLEELWYSALVASSNKAIMTLADAVGWEREAFVARMNEKAQELGMGDTRFADPTGLDSGNISSPSDISILLEEALRHEKIREAVLTPEYTLYSKERDSSHHMWNTNWILLGWIPNNLAEFLGGKTGYIPASGYNFACDVADEEGNVVHIVVLGAESHTARFTEARDAGQWVFNNYVWPEEL
ncbi:MAG: D-alanyl-D-alanine carboxypeptidase [Candidatus Magasanikbacteria bacterium]|jgi:D-alanyl-D-alanine carboxypeptidase|nr:D-alanyl-D-alanine carboxypeptidase [Candidatus Magasanikbacteria bacterium]MBT4071271.1 D-alanyl-D-alanine carboxypeptidase [Candidatus Magasanikbacteria bacterium]